MRQDEISYNEYKFADYFVLIPVNLVFALSFISILMWFFGKSIGNYDITILFEQSTALCFLLCSVSTYSLWSKVSNRWLYKIGKLTSAIVFIIGTLTIYQKLFLNTVTIQDPLGFDFILIRPQFLQQMSIQSALMFVCLGVALLVNGSHRFFNKIATTLNAAVFFISLIGLIGYIFKADSLYRIESTLRLTEHTALSGLFLSFAGLFIYPQNKYIKMLQSDGAAGSFARRISLASLILPVLFGRIGVYFHHEGIDNSTTYASVAISSFVTLIMVTWKSATAFELVNRDRLGSEKEKEKSTAQIDSLLSSSPFGIAFFSTEGEIFRANQIFRKYFQFDDSKTNIHQIEKFKDSIGFSKDQDMTSYIKSMGQGKTLELKIDLDQKVHFINLNLFPVEKKSNEFLGLGISFLDITHLKQIETELTTARDSAEVSNQAKSFFLANMSHEIRTPIGIIMGFVDILNSTSLNEEEKKHNMAIIKRNCRQLLNIIDDILDISKVEAGQIKIRKEFINTTELLQDLKSILNLKVLDKNLTVEVKALNKIPSVFFSDNTRLRQIILNICGNAIKFTREGIIGVYCFFKSGQLYFRITDTGLGIEPEQVDKLFKPFSQIDSSETREFGGTGLGLALSKKLARALGGDLILEKTEPHKGSTFLISVETGHIEQTDLIDSWIEDSSIQNKQPNMASDIENLKKKNILVVDDSPDNRLLISFMLKKLGLFVEVAVDGVDALQKVFEQDFDLILMDIQMPVMGGYETVMRLRQSGFTKPIIALTAHAMKDEKSKCLANGFSGYLTKPIDKELLISTLSAAQSNITI